MNNTTVESMEMHSTAYQSVIEVATTVRYCCSGGCMFEYQVHHTQEQTVLSGLPSTVVHCTLVLDIIARERKTQYCLTPPVCVTGLNLPRAVSD